MSDSDDIDRLLREIDAMNAPNQGAGGAVTPRPAPSVPDVRPGHDDALQRSHADEGTLPPALSATIAAGIAGGVTWLVFSILPFLNGVQGGLGAFFAVWIVAFVLQRRK